jgi:hypothetical protein
MLRYGSRSFNLSVLKTGKNAFSVRNGRRLIAFLTQNPFI